MNNVVIVTRCHHSHNVSIGLLLLSGSLCYPPRPSVLDNFLLDVHNSSYHTQPHYMAGGGGASRKEQWFSRAKQLLCMYFTFAVSRPVARFFFTGDVIQQVDGPNEAEGASLFMEGRGGDLIVRDCISCVLKAA